MKIKKKTYFIIL